ncbi:MAG TPA: sugar phosphate isomerase/epimerase [Opitutaceae bacterium]|nr:sugar phosphate isomerase/epimerase [Opitutaceae bacterium]
MKTSALLVAASLLIVTTLTAAPREYGLQLWSVRDAAKADLPGTLDKVKSWGIRTVETAGSGTLTIEEYKKLLDERGLKAPSMHAGGDRLNKEMDKVLHEAKVLGVKYIVCPWYPHEGTFDAAKGAKAAEDFNRWGRQIKDAGFQFAYHPHGYEFLPTGGAGDERVFDLIVKAVDPKLVKFQLDVFWAYRAGVDPIALLKKHPGQWVSLHLKDLRKGALRAPSPGVSPSSAPPTDKVIVGEGEIDWPTLLKEADKQGVALGFIEDESLAPVDNIPRSLKYLESIR